MKRKSQSGSFSKRNLIIAAVLLSLFVAVLLAYYGMLYSETRQKIIKSQELSAVTEAQQIDQYLSTGIYSMRFACFTLDNMIRDGRSRSEIEDFLASQSEAIVNIMSENSDGLYGYINGEFMDGNGWEPDADYDPTDRPWYISARANIGRVAIVDPYYDLESQTMTISLSKTLCDAESVAAMDFSLDYMQELTETLSSQSDSDMDLVLDQDYTVITHSDRSEVGKNYLSESGTFGNKLAEMLRSTDDSYFSMKYDGADYIVYRVPVANDWLCVSVFDATAVFAQMQRTLIFTIFAVCLVLVMILFVVRILRRKTRIAEQLESDIHKKDDEIKKISEDTYRDSLTNVKNKAALQQFSEDYAERMRGGNAGLFSVVMMDVNNLKYVNDTFGHEAGDEYIKGCCKILCHAFTYSPVFRIGGDEFVAIVTGADFNNRMERMAELAETFEQTYAKEDSDPWKRYSASVGIADCEPGDTSLDQIIKRADRAMYESKKTFKEKHGSYR